MHRQRREPGERDAEIVERLTARRARDAEELPRGERGGDGQQGREWRAPERDDEDRDGGGNYGERDAAREFGGQVLRPP